MAVATMVLVVTIAEHASGRHDSAAAWAVFAALVVAGFITALQASRLGRLGGGHVLVMGPTLIYLPVTVLALEAGGPALAASLTVAASLCYLLLSLWLPLARRIITPAVTGTVLMLIAVAVLPVVLGPVRDVPPSAPAATGLVVGLVTLIATVLVSWRSMGAWRLWSPLLAIGAGCASAVPFGAYDLQPVRDAAWVGLPGTGPPGLGLTLGAEFWTLLPAFVIVALVCSVKNIGDSLAIQQVSWRRPRSTDFRAVQGSLSSSGLGVLLSGLAGTPP